MIRGLERRALDVFEDRDEEVYHTRQPRTKSRVDFDGAAPAFSHDIDRAWLLVASPPRSERLRLKSRGRSKLRLGLSVDRHDVVGREVWDLEEKEETASNARDRTLESAAFIVPRAAESQAMMMVVVVIIGDEEVWEER